MKAGFAARVVRKLRSVDNALRPGAVFEKSCRTLLFHRSAELVATAAMTPAPGVSTQDDALNDRIVAAYRRASTADLGDSMWKMFFSTYHESIHHALLNGTKTEIGALLGNPAASDLFYGFDILTRTHNGVFGSAKVRDAYATLCLDGLLRFAEAVGAAPLDSPETWPARAGVQRDVASVLASLAKQGIEFNSPNPFPEEHGLASPRGVISYRVPQALYQAWRIRELVKSIARPRVLEIGAGLGRTAYYARAIGIRDYTIVDLPISAVAQASFLGRSLGGDSVRLEGEPEDGADRIRIVGPQAFMGEDTRYDLIVNVDSLPEMDRAVAKAYWDKIRASTPTFLSINHEANSFRVRDLLAQGGDGLDVQRGVYWMRRGYAEELVRIPVPGTQR